MTKTEAKERYGVVFDGKDDPSEERRALSANLPPVVFGELKPGDRIHYNSGWPHTSWTAEVRSGPIDGEVVVIFKTSPSGGVPQYALLDWIDCKVKRKHLHMGPIPAGLRKERAK